MDELDSDELETTEYSDKAISFLKRRDEEAVNNLQAVIDIKEMEVVEKNRPDRLLDELEARIKESGQDYETELEEGDDVTFGEIIDGIPEGIPVPRIPPWLLEQETRNTKLGSLYQRQSKGGWEKKHIEGLMPSIEKISVAQQIAKSTVEKFRTYGKNEKETLEKRKALKPPEIDRNNLPLVKKLREIENSLGDEEKENRFELGEDDDIAMEDSDAQLADMRCPITQKPLVRAAYAQCNHYFEYDAIMDMFKTKREGHVMKCFRAGCPVERSGVRFTKADVILDENMTRKIARAREKQRKSRR